MVLSFKQQFVDKILRKEKIHTIRKDPHDRWKAGMKIQFATGVRTKNYCQFHDAICNGTQKIDIRYTIRSITVRIDGVPISRLKEFSLALNDGFPSVPAFYRLFNKDFSGKIIHWTDFRY